MIDELRKLKFRNVGLYNYADYLIKHFVGLNYLLNTILEKLQIFEYCVIFKTELGKLD